MWMNTRNRRKILNRMELFEQWMLANDTACKKKVSVFLSEAETYGVSKNLVTPMKPSEMSYNELKAISDHGAF